MFNFKYKCPFSRTASNEISGKLSIGESRDSSTTSDLAAKDGAGECAEGRGICEYVNILTKVDVRYNNTSLQLK